MEASRRLLRANAHRKAPLDTSHLHRLFTYLAPRTLANARLKVLCILGYSAFLRWTEMASLTCADISFAPDHVVIHLAGSKVDQYRTGASIPLAKTDSLICPYRALRDYFQLGELSPIDTSPLLCQLYHKGARWSLKKAGLSYTRCRELLLEALRAIHLDPSLFGLHSLRSGGTTAAAACHLPDRLIMQHGRWATQSSKNRYIQDSLATRLSVSRAITS